MPYAVEVFRKVLNLFFGGAQMGVITSPIRQHSISTPLTSSQLIAAAMLAITAIAMTLCLAASSAVAAGCPVGVNNNLAGKWGIYDPWINQYRRIPNLTVQEILELRQNFGLGYYFFENPDGVRFSAQDLKILKESGLALFQIANSRSEPFLRPLFFNNITRVQNWIHDIQDNSYVDGMGFNSEAGGSACEPGEDPVADLCNIPRYEETRLDYAPGNIRAFDRGANAVRKLYISFPPPLSPSTGITAYGISAQFFGGNSDLIAPWTFSRGEWTPAHMTGNIMLQKDRDLIAKWRTFLPATYPIYPTIDWGRGEFGIVNGMLACEGQGLVEGLRSSGVPSVILFDPARGYRCFKDATGAHCNGMERLVTIADGEVPPSYAVPARNSDGTLRTKNGEQVYQLPSPSYSNVRSRLGSMLLALAQYYGNAGSPCTAP